MNLAECIRAIPDYPKPGIVFRDITTLLGDARAFRRERTRGRGADAARGAGDDDPAPGQAAASVHLPATV